MSSHPHKPHDVDFSKTHWAYLVASFCWVGRLKPASGTWGSLAALPLGLALLFFTGALGLLLFTILITYFGAKAIEHIEHHTDRSTSHDAGVFVIDEVAGQWLALQSLPILYILVPTFSWQDGLIWAAFSFFAFRLFDILKPWPCKWIDQTWRSGFGVMLDDLAAGIQALLSTVAIYFIFA